MTFSLHDLRRVSDILVLAASKEIMPRFRKLTAGQVRQKTSALDVVTEADEAAEAAITNGLKEVFPHSLIVGEEATSRNPALLEAIATADLAFVVDPIDGTKNFSSNLPLFGVMAAVMMRGKIVAGVIYDPVCRDFAYAIRGGGAWLEHEDGSRTPLKVAAPVPVPKMEAIIVTTFLPEPLRTSINASLSRFASTRWLHCSAHEYRLASGGHCHLLFYSKLMPWDHAAGWLLHQEAGGFSAHFDGSPYRPTNLSGGLICAPDEASWRSARAVLFGSVS
ncbi:MAG: inositol monophosphatase [Alphaproteobacteria bacterium]|nr:inositol monophosphatase [Alphaproteobacteria bacterium]